MPEPVPLLVVPELLPLLVLGLLWLERPPHPRAAAMANIEIASVGRIIAANFQSKNQAPPQTREIRAPTMRQPVPPMGAKAIMLSPAGLFLEGRLLSLRRCVTLRFAGGKSSEGGTSRR